MEEQRDCRANRKSWNVNMQEDRLGPLEGHGVGTLLGAGAHLPDMVRMSQDSWNHHCAH